jgi:hypothetical protein
MGTSSVVSQLNLNRFYAFEAPWQGTGLSRNYKSVCGSTIGNRMYAVAAKSNNDATNALYTSIDYGVTWTVLANTPTEFSNNNTIGKIRCDGIGRNVFISSMTTTQIYRSDDFGASWQIITLNTGLGTIPSIVTNATGQYVYATLASIGIYRSYDFGLTFQLINNSATAWLNITCSATAQYVVATRSGATYAFSDDYGTTWQFGSDTYVDVAIAQAGNIVLFCNNGNIAFSDNNGLTIRSTRNTGRNHQSIAINANGEFGISPFVNSVTESGSSYKAMLLRQPEDNVKNIQGGTGISLENDLNGGYIINATGGSSSSAVQFVSRMSWTGQNAQTLPTLDLQNYDYEMIVEIQNVSVNAWIYLYWNGGSTGTFIGDMVYPANPSTYQAGTDQQVPYYMNNSTTTYFIQVGTTAVSNANRSVINRYRMRGISSTRFALNIMGRQQLYWSDNNTITNIGMPSGGTYLASSVWYNPSNNANWAPTAITFSGQGASAPVTITWLRINKVSSA